MTLKLIALAGYLVAAGWIYWLTARVQLLLNLAEQIVDRDFTSIDDAATQPKPAWQQEHEARDLPTVVDLEAEPVVAFIERPRLVPPHPFPGPPNPVPPKPPAEDPDAFKKQLDAQFDEWMAELDKISLTPGPQATEPGQPEPT